MHATLACDRFPARNGFHLRNFFKGFQQRPTVHVLTNRKVEKGKNSWSDIDQARPIDAFVAPYSLSSHDKDPVLPMPCRRSSGLTRRATGTLRARFEAVIGTQNNCRLRSGKVEQALQHHVMKAVPAPYHILVHGEVLFLNPV